MEQVLEQDVAIICAQEDHVARTGQSLSESFLPIKSSDGLVVELRKWLDNVGHGMPYFTGWKKSKVIQPCNVSLTLSQPYQRCCTFDATQFFEDKAQYVARVNWVQSRVVLA